MTSAAETLVKLLESIPEQYHPQIVERFREELEDIKAELMWDQTLERNREKLIEQARRAKRDVASGLAKPLNSDDL